MLGYQKSQDESELTRMQRMYETLLHEKEDSKNSAIVELTKLYETKLEQQARELNKEKMNGVLIKRNRDLVKSNFDLEFKLKELKNQFKARDDTINSMAFQIKQMESEFEMRTKQNTDLERNVKELNRKLAAKNRDVQEERRKACNVEAVVKRFKSDLHDCVGYIHNPEMLKKRIKLLHSRHVQGEVIGINEVQEMGDDDFTKLGINSMGIRLRIKTAVRDHIKAKSASLSPVVQTFINLQKRRKVVRRKSPKKDINTKSTRRVYLGWKHEIKPGIYKLIPASKGGGQQILDVDKDLDYASLHSEIKNIFFPNGISQAQNMKIEEISSHLASFSGSHLPTFDAEGGFTVGKYFKSVKSCPVRMYLHTQSRAIEELSASPRSNTVEPSPTSNKVEPIRVMSDTDTDNETDTGTPTISFKPTKRRLTLKRRLRAPNLATAMQNSLATKPTCTVSSAMQDNLDPTPTTALQDNLDPTPTTALQDNLDPTPTTALQDNLDPTPTTALQDNLDPTPTTALQDNLDPTPTTALQDNLDPTPTTALQDNLDPTPTTALQDNLDPTPTAIQVNLDSMPTTAMQSLQDHLDDLKATPTMIISDHDDDDEDFRNAIKASLESLLPRQSIDTLLRQWIGNTLRPAGTDDIGPQDLLIHRRRILDSTLRAVRRLGFDFRSPFKVTFSGEIGEDLGGPRREFLSCLMKELDISIFDGSPSKRRFLHSVQKLEKRLFYNAGVLVGWSLLHGGPGIPVLSKSVYKLLVGQEVDSFLTEDVDFEVQEKVTLIKDGTEQDVIAINDWLIDLGIGPVVAPVTNLKRHEIAQQVLQSHIHFRVHTEMTQFKEGLRFIGLYDIMARNPEELSSLFVPQNEKLTLHKLRTLYTVDFSDRGHINRHLEEDTLYAFECAMQECEGDDCEITISDVLSFWTGSDDIPPLGFPKKLEITFVYNNEQQNKLPVAHTCGMTLELPRGITDPDKMLKMLTVAVRWGGEFHLA